MTLSLYGARLINCPLSRYFSDPLQYARGQSAISETFRPDVLFGPFAFSLVGASFGSTIREFSDQAPTISSPVCTNPEELGKLRFPDPDTDQSLLYLRDAIYEMAVRFQDDTIVAAILPLPIDIPPLIMGLDAWMETILFDQDGVRLIMDEMIPFFVEFANEIYADGADLIVSPSAFSSPSMVTREIANSFACPILEETLKRLKGPVILHHGGAPVMPHLDLLTGLPSVVGFVVDARDNLAEARSIIGPDPLLLGGPDNLSLPNLTPQEVTQWCRSVLTERDQDPRFILANSGPDIPLATPPENIHAFGSSVEYYLGE